MSLKTTINLLRHEQVWQPKIGGRFKNINALKSGLHTTAVRDLRQRIALWRRRVRDALAAAEGR